MYMVQKNDERRIEGRSRAVLPVTIARKQGERFGVSRDLSDTGLLVNTPSCLSLGEEVSVIVHELRGLRTRRAVVLRRERAPESDPWQYRVALGFCQ
jgi:PilZ domain